MSKHKLSKHKQEVKDQEENRKFITIVAVSAVALMLLMYLIFR